MSKARNAEPEPEQIAAFLVHNRSISDIAEQFALPKKDAQKALKGLREAGFDVYSGPLDFHGDATWVAVPHAKATTDQVRHTPRRWDWEVEPTGQPYGVVKFPASFSPQKIKIIPIDGILFGDPAHDARRFDAVLERIRQNDDTFAFLNGDIIGEIKGGTTKEREARLLERTAEFIKKMAPVAHKFMWAQQGCLEARSSVAQGFDPLEYCCERLSIPYFKEPCFIDLVWAGRGVFTLWAMHGNSTAQTKGARMNALRRPAVMHEFTHFIVGGHVGDAITNIAIKIHRDPVAGQLVPCEEFHCILGNFKKYLGTDAARRGHTPSSREQTILCLYPNGKHHVEVARQEANNA